MNALEQLRDHVGKSPAGTEVTIGGTLLSAACDEIAAPLDRRQLRALHHAAHAAAGGDVGLSADEAQFLLSHLPPAPAKESQEGPGTPPAPKAAATDKPAEPAATPAETAG